MSDDEVEHPHHPAARIPVRLSVSRLRELSRIDRGRALRAVLVGYACRDGQRHCDLRVAPQVRFCAGLTTCATFYSLPGTTRAIR
jgi:hypothetical protein